MRSGLARIFHTLLLRLAERPCLPCCAWGARLTVCSHTARRSTRGAPRIHGRCAAPRDGRYEVSGLAFNAILLLLALVLTACQTRHRPLPPVATTAVEDTLVVATPAPLDAPIPEPPASAAPAPPMRGQTSPAQETWIPLEAFCRTHRLAFSELVAAPAESRYRLAAPNSVLDLRVNSRIASWNGTEFWLAFGPKLFRNQPCVHALDAQKNLLPLLSPAWPKAVSRTVVIDPGHGGRDMGTRGHQAEALEKHLALDWALRLRPLLQAQGWRVVLTRTNDADVGLGERVDRADQSQADLFLSLHFNSGSQNNTLHGIETYCLTPVGLPSTLVRFDSDELSAVYPNNAWDEQNLSLAFQVHRALLRRTEAADRGIRRARFMTVLRDQKRPAVLIEGGYLTAPGEARRILSAAYRQQLAEGVADALKPLLAAGSQPEN